MQFPPLTYLEPMKDPGTGSPLVQKLPVDDYKFTVIDVEPHFPTG